MSFDHNITTSDHHPDSNMIHQECDKYIILIGSLSSMIKNKHINQTAFIIHVLDCKLTQKLFMNLIGADHPQEIITLLLNRYPQLCTSKTVSNYVKSRNDN